MIRLEAIPKELRRRLPKLETGGAIEILTYKRNRGLIITLREEGLYHVREHGYHREEFEAIGEGALLKLVGRIAKREFPRSTNVRLYTHAPGEQLLISDHPDIRI
ncbi:hypothetical protein ACKQTC_06610 [Peptococcus simiae]|uniref:Uncharacterized protein n=1 Tax=Peptococcus simiae TaxID=1643805 RepID=A0ABW9GZI2_9FIRM